MNLKRLLVICLLALATFSYLWGVERDLPHAPQSDEVRFLTLAAGMVATGDLNPHWFGHPGSTFLYPYAAGLRGLIAVRSDAPLLSPQPGLEVLQDDPGEAILLGRWISVAYGVLALGLLYLIGERAFGPWVGLIGAWLALLSPLTLDHVEMARTDGAGLFFGLLAIWSLVRLLERPSPQSQLLAGTCLGLAIATRYFLAGLVPLLVAIDLILVHRHRQGHPERPGIRWPAVALGPVGIAAGLFLGAPFLLLEIPTVLENLAHETRTGHTGADGLSYLGNLGWYLTVALPRSVPWTFLALTLVGIGHALIRRAVAPLLLLGFVAIFLLGISFASLHWGRWLIQILPLLALFAAGGLVALTRAATDWFRAGPRVLALVLCIAVFAISVEPARSYFEFAALQGAPGTQEIGRAWILENISPQDRMIAELYSAPLQETALQPVPVVFSLTEISSSPRELATQGYDLAMVSSSVYQRFFAEPERYQQQIGFYRKLFRGYPRLAEFRPDANTRGPVIRIYRLTEKQQMRSRAERKGKTP